MPEEWCGKLRTFIAEHRTQPRWKQSAPFPSVNPALGLIAAHQYRAAAILEQAGFTPEPGVCAVAGDHLDYRKATDSYPDHRDAHARACCGQRTLLVLSRNKGYLVPLDCPGRHGHARRRAIGFRAAGLADRHVSIAI